MDLIIRCTHCGGELVSRSYAYTCNDCSKVYPLQNDVIVMEDVEEVDLRIPNQLVNLHRFRDERMYFDRFVESDVEFFGRLHSVNFPNFHIELLSPYLNDSLVVDLGCGQSPYINSFPDDKIQAFYGLDLSDYSLNIAQKNFKKKFPLILIKHGIKDTPFPNSSVDVAISSEILEHIDDPIGYLHETYRICKPGGYVSLSTPCVSMYFYPHNFLYLARYPARLKTWYKQINAHKHWDEALSWHPGLRPKVLRAWVEQAGFEVVRHETRLWYYHTPVKLTWRIFSFLEKLGLSSSGRLFGKYLKLTDRLLASNIPLVKWAGIRQFILGRKKGWG